MPLKRKVHKFAEHDAGHENPGTEMRRSHLWLTLTGSSPDLGINLGKSCRIPFKLFKFRRAPTASQLGETIQMVRFRACHSLRYRKGPLLVHIPPNLGWIR